MTWEQQILQQQRSFEPRFIEFHPARNQDPMLLARSQLIPLNTVSDTRTNLNPTNPNHNRTQSSSSSSASASANQPNGHINHLNHHLQRRQEEAEQDEAEGLLRPRRWLFDPAKVDPLMKWPRISPVGSGLRNLGNSCFMNAVLQCFAYTPPFVNYLTTALANPNNSRYADVQGFNPLHEVRQLFSTMHAGRERMVVPKTIFSRLPRFSKSIRPYQQHDAQEFALAVLETCQNALLRAEGQKVDPRTAETTAIHQIFGGYLRSQVKWNKEEELRLLRKKAGMAMTAGKGRPIMPVVESVGNTSNTFDPFLMISVEIQGSTIDRCLQHFTQEETLDSDNRYTTPSGVKVQATKRLTIHRLPRILVLHLKRFSALQRGSRFSMGFGRISRFVQYPVLLDIREYCSRGADGRLKQHGTKYRLIGVVVHEGSSLHSGHYYSFVRGSNDTWYWMDDERVSSVPVERVLRQEAYMLFYQCTSTSESTPKLRPQQSPAATMTQPAKTLRQCESTSSPAVRPITLSAPSPLAPSSAQVPTTNILPVRKKIPPTQPISTTPTTPTASSTTPTAPKAVAFSPKISPVVQSTMPPPPAVTRPVPGPLFQTRVSEEGMTPLPAKKHKHKHHHHNESSSQPKSQPKPILQSDVSVPNGTKVKSPPASSASSTASSSSSYAQDGSRAGSLQPPSPQIPTLVPTPSSMSSGLATKAVPVPPMVSPPRPAGHHSLAKEGQLNVANNTEPQPQKKLKKKKRKRHPMECEEEKPSSEPVEMATSSSQPRKLINRRKKKRKSHGLPKLELPPSVDNALSSVACEDGVEVQRPRKKKVKKSKLKFQENIETVAGLEVPAKKKRKMKMKKRVRNFADSSKCSSDQIWT